MEAQSTFVLPQQRELLALSAQLPPAVLVENIGDAVFEIYKAKDGYNPEWKSDALHALVREARKGFWRHGNVELEDSKDAKSFVYLIRAKYLMHNEPAEEWLSVRFIPGNGEPAAAWDLDVCSYKGRSLRDLVKEELFFNNQTDILPYITSISRLCGINPYFSSEKLNSKQFTLPARKQFSAVSFALINKFFLDKEQTTFTYFTSLINNGLIDKVFKINTPKGSSSLNFEPAHKLLNLADANIRIERTVWSYQFPSNFLHMKELFGVLDSLLADGKISPLTIQTYLKTDLRPSQIQALEFENKDAYKKIARNVGDLLHTNGIIIGANITGEELRAIVDKDVNDGPELKLMSRSAWQNEVSRFLDEVKKIY